ncbi:MAG: response regulator [Bdellovibrionaceae bacterium]|nr:response regulator [Pseudobdellovibrionaceae bacterium]
MEMIDRNKRSASIMIFGLTLLLVPAIYMYLGLSKIEDMIHLRARSSLLQDEFSEYGNLLKDEVLAGALKIPVSQVDGSRDIQGQLSELERSIHKHSVDDPKLQTAVQSISTYRARLTSETPSTDELLEIQTHVQRILRAADGYLQTYLDVQFSELQKEIRSAVLICLTSVCLAFMLIGYSIVSYLKQSRRMRRYAQELLTQKEKAETSDALKAAFLSTVSHEIRTPLNGIIGLSDAIVHGDGDVANVRLVKTIHQSGKTLLRIVNDILDFSKIDSGNISLDTVSFAIAEVIEQVHVTLNPIALKKNISLHFEIDEHIPKFVTGDPTRVSQILYNLIGNAIKFTEIGSVIVRVAPSSHDKNSISFSIQDTGIGMTVKEREQLFKPFYQARHAGTSGETGTGLGLAIAKKLTEAMGGKINVTSQVGQGSHFTFDLVFIESSNEKIGANIEPPFSVTDLMAQKATVAQDTASVLIVDDNPTNQIVAQALLGQLGISSISVSDGREALDICSKTQFNLILMDLQMPQMDGYQASLQLRQMDISVPIIALTASADAIENERCFSSGMDGVLTKPITMSDIQSVVEEFLTQDSAVDFVVLDKLTEKIGAMACRKVIHSYLTTIRDLTLDIAHLSRQQDAEQLQRMGHKYSTSSATVGANKLSIVLKQIENAPDISAMMSSLVQLPSLLRRTRIRLDTYLQRGELKPAVRSH